MTILIILCFEESVIQRYSIDPLHSRILQELGIDIEEDGHVDRLAFIQPLLLEAEALDLAEIRRHLRGRHAVRRHAYDVFRLRVVRCSVERQRRLTWQHAHFSLLGYEFPGQDVGC